MSIFNGNCGGGGGSAVAGAHASTHGTGGSDPLAPSDIGAAPAIHGHTPAEVGLADAERTANKGEPDGYAPLNAAGLIPAAYLPSFVDDIVEVANAAALPATGDASVVYVALDTSKAYRWGGSAYVEITASPGSTDSVVEGSVNLYFTAARAAAAQINADWNSASGKSQILNKPTLGTASSKDVATTGNALAGQVVLGNDTRLTDPRTAISHTHPQSEVTGLVDDLASLTLSDRIPSRADFDARAAAVRGLTAGSGFLEWGRRYAGGGPVGEGMWAYSDAMALGRYPTGAPVGAGSHAPVVSVAGCVCHLLAGRSNIEDCYVKFAPPPNAATPSSRHDLVILEVWHERVDLKDVVYLFGCVQCGAGGVTLADGSIPAWRNDLVAAGYSAYGAWEAAPVAGYCARWSTMTDAQRRAMAADPRHNLYLDHDGAVIQVRWRLRSIAGPGIGWLYVNPLRDSFLGHTISYGSGQVIPRGQLVAASDFVPYHPHTTYRFDQTDTPASPGLWIGQATSAVLTPVIGHRGICHALPIALVKRERNTGIYHATHNPGGCAENTGVLSFPNTYNVLPWHSIGTLNITSNALAFPGGGFGSLLDDQDSAGDQAYLLQETNVPADTADYTFSVYLHKGDFNGSLLEFNLHAQSGLYGTGKYAQMSIDWTTNTALTSGTLTVKSSSMTAIGSGWYRLVCTVANNGYGYATMKVYPCQGYTGQRGSVYIYDAAIKREVSSLSDCFSTPKSGGLIADGATAHPSGLYADQVVADDVLDLRMGAHRYDPEGILRRAWKDYRAGTLRRTSIGIVPSGVTRDVKAIAPVVSAQGLEVEPSVYNPATGEIVYPTAYVGAGAVTVATLINRSGQAVMQIVADPAMDGIVDIDLANNLLVDLPYFLPAEA